MKTRSDFTIKVQVDHDSGVEDVRKWLREIIGERPNVGYTLVKWENSEPIQEKDLTCGSPTCKGHKEIDGEVCD